MEMSVPRKMAYPTVVSTEQTRIVRLRLSYLSERYEKSIETTVVTLA